MIYCILLILFLILSSNPFVKFLDSTRRDEGREARSDAHDPAVPDMNMEAIFQPCPLKSFQLHTESPVWRVACSNVCRIRATDQVGIDSIIFMNVVGKPGFEPGAPASRTLCSTRLSHFPLPSYSIEENSPRSQEDDAISRPARR